MVASPATAPEMAPRAVGLPILHPLGDDPGDGGGGGGELRIDEGAGGQRSGVQRAAGVEAEPAHPQHSGADEAEHHRVGRHILLRIADALAQIEGADQGGDAAGDMHDRAAGKVKDRPVGRGVGEVQNSADAPDHVRHGAIDDQRPEARKTAMELNLTRSAKAPVISAGVMMANMSW